MDAPFDMTPLGLRERPLSGDPNQNTSQIYRTMREMMRCMMAPRASMTSAASAGQSAFIGDGFRVVPNSPAGMSVLVTPGMGFIYDAVSLPTDIGAPDLENVDDLSSYKPLSLLSPVLFSVPAAPGAGQGRTDIIEVKVDRRLENSVPRQQLDETTLAFGPHSFFKTLAFGHDGRTGVVGAGGGNSTAGLSYKVGTAAAVIAAGGAWAGRDNLTVVAPPATSPGYVKIAEIVVNNGTTSIIDQMMVDRRPVSGAGGCVHFSAAWNLVWNAGAPIATLLNLNAPPGVRVGMQPVSAARARGNVIVAGGDILRASGTVSLWSGAGLGNPAKAVLGQSTPFDIQISTDFTSGVFDTAVPALTMGIGTRFWFSAFYGQYLDALVVNVTDPLLENINVSVSGLLTY